MFKKLILSILVIGNCYAIEPIKESSGKNSIQQNTEEVKNNMDISDINDIPDISDINSHNYSAANEIKTESNLFNIRELIAIKHFRKMTNDERDWARLFQYNLLSRACQKFWQRVIADGKVTKENKDFLYDAQGFRMCLLEGIDPIDVLFDELKFNIDPSCWVHSNFPNADQLETLKEEIATYLDSFVKHLLNIRILQEKVNTDNTALVASVYIKRLKKSINTLGNFIKKDVNNPVHK